MEKPAMKVDFTLGALPYAEKLYWHILLLEPLGKRPRISKARGGRGVYDASADPQQIRQLGKLCPNGNIGAACGEASGFVTLDIDPRDKGDEAIRAFAAQGYSFPAGPRQRTGNNGWHLLFEYEPWMKRAKGKLTKGCDFKKDGGFIVIAPSFTGPSDAGPGGLYRWEVSPFEVPVPRIPHWLREKLLPPPAPTYRGPITTPSDIRALIRETANAQDGSKNNVLYWACRRAKEAGALTPSAQRAFIEAAVAVGEDRHKAISTVNSAVNARGTA
jgi:hypothetical protein